MGIWHGVPGVLSNQNRTVSLCEYIRPRNEDSFLVNHVYNILVLCPKNYWPLIPRKQKKWGMQSKYFCNNYITCHCMEDTQEETLED